MSEEGKEEKREGREEGEAGNKRQPQLKETDADV